MPSESRSKEELLREVAQLKSRLETLQATLNSILTEEADALVVAGEDGERIFTLRGEQEPYRVFVETMNEGAAMVAPDGTIVYSNRRFADMVKAPLEKVIGAAFGQFVDPGGCAALQELQKDDEASGFRRECTLRTLPGGPVPVYLSVRPMRIGEIRNLCVIATDITERKRAEEQVRRSEQQLRLIFKQLPAALWTTDSQLRVVSASGAPLAPLHLHAEDLIGKTVQEFLGDTNEQSPLLAAHLAALKGKRRSCDYNLAGNIFSVNVQPLRDAEGEISGVIGIALDVTENKRALASVAKLAAIVQSTQDAIFGATLSGYITTWNRGAEQLFGYSAEEIAGRPVSILVPEGRERELEGILERLRRDENVRPYETVRRCKDGRLIDVSMTVSTVKDAMGRPTGLSAIAHNLGDRKQVETELRKLTARLLKMQDETRRDMARELHDSVIQELAAAVINLAIMQDSPLLPAELRETLKETLKITENAVREIRTFSYLLHPPLLDVTGLQSALRWFVEGYSKRSGVHVELDLPEGRDRMGKEIELTLFRIVQEALTNIHRHSGGRKAVIRMKRAEGELILTVSDNGHGMDGDTLKKVRREGAVLGVGIAGMKQRLQQLGGRLSIDSGNSGTTVTVTLPVAR